MEKLSELMNQPGGKAVSKWVIHSKGGPNEESFEICVIREDNAHGIRSYGWFDDSKLLISHNGGPYRWPLTKKIWDKQIILAQEVADELNAEELAHKI